MSKTEANTLIKSGLFPSTIPNALVDLNHVGICRKPRVMVEDVMDEDVDVKKERQRVMSGSIHTDVLQLKGLSKVAPTRQLYPGIAVLDSVVV